MEARRAPQPPSYPFQLSLRIRHPSIDPDSISRELQLDPEHSFRAGDPRESNRSLTAIATVHTESYWLGTIDPATLLPGEALKLGFPPELRLQSHETMAFGGLDSALLLWTNGMLRRHAEFFRRLESEGGEVRLIVALSARKARGFTLTPHVSKALSELRIPVDFELAHR
ncbi:MAG TPA: hypothetical protein VJQ52_17940 [Steroidobacteraceae bacterium]|nr:hypothetical protein [Steroidobacteraceae bacterium]